MAAKYKKNVIAVSGGHISVYASPTISAALVSVMEEMTLFKGIKLGQVLETVYVQGKKDGARSAFQTVAGKILEAETLVPHKNPGNPRKKRLQ